jgi:hypothetical protein
MWIAVAILFPVLLSFLFWLVYPYPLEARFHLNIGGESSSAQTTWKPGGGLGLLLIVLVVGSGLCIGTAQHWLFELASRPSPAILFEQRTMDNCVALIGLSWGFFTGSALWLLVINYLHPENVRDFLLSTNDGFVEPHYKFFNLISRLALGFSVILAAGNWCAYHNFIRVTPDAVEYRHWSDTALTHRDITGIQRLVWYPQRWELGRLDIVFTDGSALDTSPLIYVRNQRQLVQALNRAANRHLPVERRQQMIKQ